MESEVRIIPFKRECLVTGKITYGATLEDAHDQFTIFFPTKDCMPKDHLSWIHLFAYTYSEYAQARDIMDMVVEQEWGIYIGAEWDTYYPWEEIQTLFRKTELYDEFFAEKDDPYPDVTFPEDPKAGQIHRHKENRFFVYTGKQWLETDMKTIVGSHKWTHSCRYCKHTEEPGNDGTFMGLPGEVGDIAFIEETKRFWINVPSLEGRSWMQAEQFMDNMDLLADTRLYRSFEEICIFTDKYGFGGSPHRKKNTGLRNALDELAGSLQKLKNQCSGEEYTGCPCMDPECEIHLGIHDTVLSPDVTEVGDVHVCIETGNLAMYEGSNTWTRMYFGHIENKEADKILAGYNIAQLPKLHDLWYNQLLGVHFICIRVDMNAPVSARWRPVKKKDHSENSETYPDGIGWTGHLEDERMKRIPDDSLLKKKDPGALGNSPSGGPGRFVPIKKQEDPADHSHHIDLGPCLCDPINPNHIIQVPLKHHDVGNIIEAFGQKYICTRAGDREYSRWMLLKESGSIADEEMDYITKAKLAGLGFQHVGELIPGAIQKLRELYEQHLIKFPETVRDPEIHRLLGIPPAAVKGAEFMAMAERSDYLMRRLGVSPEHLNDKRELHRAAFWDPNYQGFPVEREIGRDWDPHLTAEQNRAMDERMAEQLKNDDTITNPFEEE